MLINIKLREQGLVTKIMSNGVKSIKISEGVYQCFHFNFNDEIIDRNIVNEYPEFEKYKECYGVADSYQQVLEKYPELLVEDKYYVVSIVVLDKNKESSTGGWRWHKWGEYIGDQTPTCEYLFDEPIIEEIIVFHIYEVENG